MFKDYETLLALAVRHKIVDKSIGYKTFYANARQVINETSKIDPLAKRRACDEIAWYEDRRPYFNLHPLINAKLLEINEEIELEWLNLPLRVMEIRTEKKAFLVSELSFYESHRVISCSISENKSYYSFWYTKDGTVGESLTRDPFRTEEPEDQRRRVEAMLIIAGVCMLAKDKSIVTPVILNADRRENMSDEKIEKYAKRAIRRTGRIGFDVGRELERNKALAHYRNGCFAVYHVGKDHELYPDNCEADRVPVIKWRNGAIVNRDNVPRVPTGFKG